MVPNGHRSGRAFSHLTISREPVDRLNPQQPHQIFGGYSYMRWFIVSALFLSPFSSSSMPSMPTNIPAKANRRPILQSFTVQTTFGAAVGQVITATKVIGLDNCGTSTLAPPQKLET
jgi:hypothetical protein